jgi:hypothetical protein
MFTAPVQPEVGNVFVATTNNRGFTPEELLDRAMNKIIYVGENSHPTIRAQAEAFKRNVADIVLFYMKEAVYQDRVTIANILTQAGHPELTKLLEN